MVRTQVTPATVRLVERSRDRRYSPRSIKIGTFVSSFGFFGTVLLVTSILGQKIMVNRFMTQTIHLIVCSILNGVIVRIA